MALSLENSQRLEAIRALMLAGKASREDELEAFTILRQDRVSASIASTKSRTAKAAAAAPVDTKALLAGLGSTVFTKQAPTPAAASAAGSFKL